MKAFLHYRQGDDGAPIVDGVTVPEDGQALLPAAWLVAYPWLFAAGPFGTLAVLAANATLHYRVKSFQRGPQDHWHMLLDLVGVQPANPPRMTDTIATALTAAFQEAPADA